MSTASTSTAEERLVLKSSEAASDAEEGIAASTSSGGEATCRYGSPSQHEGWGRATNPAAQYPGEEDPAGFPSSGAAPASGASSTGTRAAAPGPPASGAPLSGGPLASAGLPPAAALPAERCAPPVRERARGARAGVWHGRAAWAEHARTPSPALLVARRARAGNRSRPVGAPPPVRQAHTPMGGRVPRPTLRRRACPPGARCRQGHRAAATIAWPGARAGTGGVRPTRSRALTDRPAGAPGLLA